MREAVLAFSRKGRFKERINSLQIQSREHARKLWPLVSPEIPHELVTYVSPSFEADTKKLIRKSYFARLPRGRRKSVAKHLKEASEAWNKASTESSIHRKAKELLAQELSRRIAMGEKLIWCFADKSRSDYPLKGDLLLGAASVQTEYSISTPFDKNYRLDAAVLGPSIDGSPLILAGIEIEFTHAFDGIKGLISKTLGFPIISVDITNTLIEEITPEWASQIIESTTRTAVDGRRKTYIYLHDLVYPQFVFYPEGLLREPKHHFLVFVPNEDIDRIHDRIKALAMSLAYGPEVAIHKVNGKSDQARKQLVDLGLVVGADWELINDQQCLRIAVARPLDTADLRAHQFHSALARILLAESNSLVGYKYMAGIYNNNISEDIWIHSQWQGLDREPIEHRMLPKRLAEPISSILEVIQTLQAVSEEEQTEIE